MTNRDLRWPALLGVFGCMAVISFAPPSSPQKARSWACTPPGPPVSVTWGVDPAQVGLPARPNARQITDSGQKRQSAGEVAGTDALKATIEPCPDPAGDESRLMDVAAYCSCARCCGPWASIPFHRRKTAGGYPLNLVTAMVAVDLRQFPYGTHLSIPGYCGGRWAPVLDACGVQMQDYIEVYYYDHDLALAFGRRQVVVKITRAKP